MRFSFHALYLRNSYFISYLENAQYLFLTFKSRTFFFAGWFGARRSISRNKIKSKIKTTFLYSFLPRHRTSVFAPMFVALTCSFPIRFEFSSFCIENLGFCLHARIEFDVNCFNLLFTSLS